MRFGLKEKLIAVGVGVVLTGTVVATAAINPFKDTAEPSAPSNTVSEEENMETSKVDLTPIEQAVSRGVEQINSVTDEAINKIQSTTHEPQVLSSESVSSEIPEPKTIPLDIVSKTDDFKLFFKSVTINYEYKAIDINYSLLSTKTIVFDYDKVKCIDKKGNNLKKVRIGGVIGWNDEMTEFVGHDCHMEFYGFDDPADITTVELTYAFEGYDPVTVTIDIPLE